VRAPGCEDQECIGSANIRPIRWQRPDASLSRLSVEDSVFTPGVGEADHYILTPAQRMERVRYTESLRIAATTGS